MENGFLKVDDLSITKFLSPYLNGGRLVERWHLSDIEWRERKIRAKARMSAFYVSPTDTGFHLSNLTGLEIVAQLRIIHIHLVLGLTEKTREVWFLRGSERCVRSIRDPDRIDIEITSRFKEIGNGKTLVDMEAILSDRHDGRFEYKALVSI